MFEWSIETDDRGIVVLKGEEPLGYPCETWLNGELLERSDEGSFSWATEVGLPSPVHGVNRYVELYAHDPSHLKYMLRLEAQRLWEKDFHDTDYSDAYRVRANAYVQHIRNVHQQLFGEPLPVRDIYE